MAYLQRMVDGLLTELLESSGAVLIEGPKWCGKTTTATQQAASILRLQNPDTREAYIATAKTKPSLLLKGETPRLIDEWQIIPQLWDAVRVMVDDRNEMGQFILTGSNSIDNQDIMHSGTGRIARLRMQPMSLFETQESTGEISLKALFENPNMDIDAITSQTSIEELIFAACRGGWPAAHLAKTDSAKLNVARNYIDSLCSMDISTVDGVQRNEELARAILRSYARNISTLAKKSNMLKDVVANFETVAMNTFDSYLNAFQRLFVIQDIPAWCPAIRSASAIRSGMKREFCDPSIAVAALGLTPQMLEMDLKTFGFIFETMCIRDLKAYSQSLRGSLAYYHDRYDLETDAVLRIANGQFALIEFKLGSSEIEEGAQHLIEVQNLIKEYNKKEKQVPLREPDLLIVITGGQLAYTREDGVKVIPLACLRD
ncbi:MAG: ATP-binding protein [Bacteroidales bacterium]|nr:ATP-binding protein [Bacteroidales bacterium]